MRIGCLQFAPQVGDVDNNLNRADSVLSKANPEDMDLLVLPELAFSGELMVSILHFLISFSSEWTRREFSWTKN
jgi:protein N-terminal amidase